MTPQPVIAHYRISTKLGEGGMGAVYRATDTKLSREVAIKVLPESFASDPDRLARFTREAQVLASLNHPNIAAIYGVEEHAIVLELVEGAQLAGPVSEEEALPVIHQLIDALEYAHEKGIVHRDLKPANIKVTPEGRLKVLDFGLAKALATDAVAGDPVNSPTMTMRATMAGVIMGTAAYMSPEQARGQAVDKRADIWSFGVVVYELLTGRTLFAGDTVSDTLAAVLRQDPEIDAVPPRFRRLLRLCLARDPRQRLRDISGARLLLEETVVEAPLVSAGRPTRWMAIAAAATLLAVVALAIALRAGRTPERPLIRLSVDLGPEAFADQRTVFAFSPDGARMVFTSRAADGKQLLAVREMGDVKPTVLRDTESATDPFFSPDGQTVGFLAEGTLKKISIHGGAAITVAPVSANPRGASWGDDGNIVVALTASTGLSRVPASGGTPQPLTDPHKKGQMTHRWPQVLPGARAVLFTAHSATNHLDDAEIDALDLATKQWKTVQKGGYFGRYLPSGHLLYVHQGELFAVRFDPDRVETKGAPIAILHDIAANLITGTGRFDFASATGGTFGYLPGTPETVPARLAWIDADGKTEIVNRNGTEIGASAAFSPDGKSIASIFGSFGAQSIRVWDSRRDVVTAITNKPQEYNGVAWVPDGRHLVYGSFDGNTSTLWWARTDGGGEAVKLAEGKSPFLVDCVSPDGRLVAYSQDSPETGQDIWLLPLDLKNAEAPRAGTPQPFLRGPDSDIQAAFSPDGHWVAYASQESGKFEVYVRPFPGPGGRWQISSGQGMLPRWSGAGHQILYTDRTGAITAVDYEVHGDIFAPGKLHPWTTTRINANIGRPYFALSPDAKRVLTYIRAEDSAEKAPNVHVMLLFNFFDELKRTLP